MASKAAEDTILADLKTALEAVSVQAGDNATLLSVTRFDKFTGSNGDLASARIKWTGIQRSVVGAGLDSVGSGFQVDVDIRLDYVADSPDTSGAQLLRLVHDSEQAILGIDYAAKDYAIPSVVVTPFDEEDSEDPVIGARISLTYGHEVNRTALETFTAPL